MATSTSTREFIRNFSRLKRTAANGGEVHVHDRAGRTYVFRVKESGPSLGSQLADLCGKHDTGIREKSLAGYGHNRK
jgi:hypothetical protein